MTARRNADPADAGMNDRKKRILWAVVQDYVSSAEPVGSRTIAKNYDLGVSSATIRNEMQDLGDEGYLEQPHTSAGRIPSIKGYRFYVDCLMEPSRLTGEEEDRLTHMIADQTTKVDEIFRNMARVVSSLTQTLSVAARQTRRSCTFNYIRFLPLDGQRAILLVVTQEGRVSNTVVNIPPGSSIDELQLLADRLNHFLHGKDISAADEQTILAFQKDVERDLTPFSRIFVSLRRSLAPKQKVYSGGAAGLIRQPEFQNVEKMQDILNLLEERDLLHSILDTAMDRPIAVRIGSENPDKSLADLSIVKAQFQVGGEVIGTMAVIGPTRMEYGRVIGLLYFMQKHLEHMLKNKE